MKRRRKLKKSIVIILTIILIALAGYTIYKIIDMNTNALDTGKKVSVEAIKEHYNNYVITNKEATIYKKGTDEYSKIGTISNGIELSLVDTDVTEDTQYFQIDGFDDEYYIFYEDVDKIDSLTEVFEQDRYKKYIPYNENIVTTESVKFYDEDNQMIYTINKSFDLPIIIKDSDKYGIEYNNRLLYISKEDVQSTKESHNTDSKNVSHIGALNYHFFWDDETESRSKCDQEICHSKSQFKSHLELFKEMGLLTITMKETEMYIDGKVQLPPSVLITIDDGWRIELGIKMLNEYQMHGTVFLVTGDYDYHNYLEGNDYVEFHSHTDKMHNGGVCSGGQGGGIKCLPHDTILKDLQDSSQKLDGSTVLCYPFYEYNDYAIGIVKEAGYTMAFAGESSYRDNHIKVGSDKYSLPRFVIVTYTTMNDLKTFLK